MSNFEVAMVIFCCVAAVASVMAVVRLNDLARRFDTLIADFEITQTGADLPEEIIVGSTNLAEPPARDPTLAEAAASTHTVIL